MAQTFDCPSCGAPLDIEGDTSTIHCKYCYASVIVPEELRNYPPKEPERIFINPISIDLTRFQPTQVFPVAANKPNNFEKVLLYVLSIIIILAIAIGLILLFFPLFNNSALWGISKFNFRLDNEVVLMPTLDNNPPDLIIPVSFFTSEGHKFVYMDGKTQSILWHTDNLTDKYYQAKVFPTENKIFILDQTLLTAYDRLTGKVQWKVTLDNGVGYCKTCLEQFGDSIVIILKDGTLQAIDSNNGKLTWHKTLNNTRADLFSADRKPAVQEVGEDRKPVFYIFDPFSGQMAQTISPVCKVNHNDNTTDEFQVSEDGKSILLLFDGCIQRLSLPDGHVLTQTLAGEKEKIKPQAWFATKHIITQDVIYYTENGSDERIDRLEIKQWASSHLIQDEKYALLPKFVIANLLVIEAIPDFDHEQHEYWGVDSQSGNRLWQYNQKGEGRLSYSEIQPTSTGAFIIQCRENPDACTWGPLDLKTGVGSNSGKGPGGPFIDATWGKDTLYLGAEGKLTVINTTNGKIISQWP